VVRQPTTNVRVGRRRTYSLPMKGLATGLLIAVSLLLPAGASAHTVVAPPGNSGVSQYLEVVPSANGGRPSGPIASGATGQRTLSPATERAFARQGAVGRSAAALANATAPIGGQAIAEPGGHSTAHGSLGVGAAAPSAASAGGESPASSLAKALSGSAGGGGLGLWLPVILAGCAVGGGVLALIRRRHTT
jgi:hypothetical protein